MTLEDALRIDAENKNTYWQDAINKEMKNIAVAFEILKEGESAPIGWSKFSGHIIFDVKMDFTR